MHARSFKGNRSHYGILAGVDLGILEWWGCMTNVCKVQVKILGHAHFIKTTPILLPRRAATWLETAPQTVWRVVLQLV